MWLVLQGKLDTRSQNVVLGFASVYGEKAVEFSEEFNFLRFSKNNVNFEISESLVSLCTVYCFVFT